jgi:hypothetical protein
MRKSQKGRMMAGREKKVTKPTATLFAAVNSEQDNFDSGKSVSRCVAPP